jgi:hypothetical protein
LKTFILVLVLLILPSVLRAAEPPAERPHWSLEVKLGDFMPDIENWKDHYGRYTVEYGGSLAYKIFRQLEIGIGGNYIKDRGQGFAPLHNMSTGSVKYELYPAHAFVLFRGVFNEHQWLVPYVGGGWTRMFYREEVVGQNVARGTADGYHTRAGLQILLDGLDPSAANSFFLDYGVDHTYLFLEAESTHVTVDDVSGNSVNLGGTSFLGGLLFEF